MPSPFPGMDPYLEGSPWLSFHSQLCAEMARQLTPKLRPRYLARLTERFVTVTPEDFDQIQDSMLPDVSIVKSSEMPAEPASLGITAASVRVPTLLSESIRQYSVEILDRRDRKLVTAIEVLSPSNKRGKSRDEYLSKRDHIIHGSVHLLEFDLLHEGRRLPMRKPVPKAPYYVYLCRSETRPVTEVWAIPLNQPLPTLPVPLLAGDSDAALNLQEALTKVYDLCAYDIELDYSMAPEASLSPAELAWVDQRLRAAGLRH